MASFAGHFAFALRSEKFYGLRPRERRRRGA